MRNRLCREKKKNSGNPNTTNTGAAGQTATINLHEVSLFSLLILNQCYAGSHPKHGPCEIPAKEKFPPHILSQLHTISEQHY